MVFPLALRAFQVPWPTHVKLTSAFSAMPYLPLDTRGGPEYAIFPHAQDEDADRRERPDVREDEIARRSVEAKQQDDQHGERAVPPPFDSAHGQQEHQRQQRQPLVRPDLIGYEGAEGEPERHAIDQVPSAAPRGPHGRRGEREGAQVGEGERDLRSVSYTHLRAHETRHALV